jgi:hypothetical protein
MNTFITIANIALAMSLQMSTGDLEVQSTSTAIFTENRGQWDDKALFFCRQGGMDCWFTSGGPVYRFVRETVIAEEPSPLSDDAEPGIEGDAALEALVLSSTFVGASSDVVVEGTNLLGGRSNYFLGNDPSLWRVDVPSFSGVLYRGVYPGIDIRYYTGDDGLKYDIIVSPGADPSQVVIRYEGVSSVAVTDEGDMRIETAWGAIGEGLPAAYQEVGSGRIPVEVGYRLSGDGEFGFVAVEYDRALPLIIDPSVQLIYSTYLGGSSSDYLEASTVSQDGSVFLTGSTRSSDFPTQNPYQGFMGGGYSDAVVTRLSLGDPQLFYSTYLGGSGLEAAHDIDVDPSGCAFVTGSTYSTDFPIQDAFQPGNAGNADAFVTELTASGNQLIFSTYLGGLDTDGGYGGIAVGTDACIYVTGVTSSSDFPVLNAFQSSLHGVSDVAVTKFTPEGDQLVYSTYLGGEGPDECFAIEVDSDDCAYVAGRTFSGDFPVQNPFQSIPNAEYEVFLTKFTSEGNQLAYSTFLGGSSSDSGYGLAVDDDGCAYVTGHTQSIDFPVENPFQGSYGGGTGDAFLTKFAPEGNTLVFSTYLGGSTKDAAREVAVDPDGCAHLTGYTNSADFPLIDAYQTTPAGGYDAFVTRFTSWGNTLYYSTYFGGSEDDYGFGVAVDSYGCAYVSGMTYSADFPVLNPFQGSLSGTMDIFAAKFGPCGTPIDPWNPDEAPTGLSIVGVCPNPFATTASITFELAQAEQVILQIRDLAGRVILMPVNSEYPAGIHALVFDGTGLSSGIYLCRLQAGSASVTTRIVLIR